MSRAGAGRLRRRRLRLAAGVAVALATLLTWDQRGLLAAVRPPVETGGRLEVAGTSVLRPSASLAGGFEALSARLRLGDPSSVPGLEAEPVVADAMELAAPPAAAPPLAQHGGDVAIAPPPAAFTAHAARPQPQPLPPSRYDPSTAAGGTWALIIGVNDYPGARYDLASAVNDANDVNDALASLGVTSDRRMVLRDQQAGADTIRAALDWLTAHAGTGSTMVLFFAGHVQRLEPGREALVGADGGIVRDTEVAELLDRSPAERAWIAVAGCFGGGFDEVVRPGRILTAAAPSDRVAYENEGFGRSYLVEYMVRRAILGHGISTVEGAFSWASAELKRDYPDRLPVQFDAVGGEFELRVGPPPPAAPSGASGGGTQPPPSTPPSDSCSALTIGVVRCS
jgi:hypothetical protein